MKKILGYEFSFFGNGDDTLQPAGAALTGFAAKLTDPVFAPSFLKPANIAMQTEALTVSSFDVAVSNSTLMTTTPGSGQMSASAGPAANNENKYGSSGAGSMGSAFTATSELGSQNDPQSGITGGVFPNPETVTLAGSGLVFVNTYGAGVNDPFHTAIIYAEHELQSNFTNSVTIRVSFDLGDAHGFLAYNSFFNTVRPDYATLKNALSSHATSPDDIAAINAFAAAAPSNTHSSSSTTGFLVAAGMARVLGLAGASNNIDDALILGSGFTWNFDPNNRSAGGYDAIGAIEHEISEGGMGRVGGLGYQNNTWAPMDLFRFTSAGQRDYTGGQDGVTTYFSPNGTNPDLTHPYHNSVNAQGTFDGQDPADWQVGGDSFGFGSPGVPGLLSATDLRVMDVLGWTRSSIDDFPANTSTTGVVSVGGSATGNLEIVGDHDWFRVQLTAGFQYTIDEQGQSVGVGTLSDPFMALYNTAGQFITSNDDGGGSLNSRIVYTPTVTGSYYIDAGAYQDQYSGTYRVSVTVTPAGTISINDVSITEGNSGTKIETFTVTRSGGTAAFAVNFTTTDGTATVADHDYVANAGTLNFAAGVNTQTISVTINGDTKIEANETFSVNLSGATNGATIGDNLGLGTIINDDRLRDFDADGHSDILWQNANGTPAVWLMNGTVVATYGGPLFNPGPQWHEKAAGDFNGDGKADVLWQNDNGTPAAWLMDGTGVAAYGSPLFNPGPEWHEKAAGDFNGDGKADVLWQNDNGAPAVWLMDGTNVAAYGGPLFNPGPEWHEKAAGDFNGDGKADILWQNDNGAPAVWLMDGTGVAAYGSPLVNPGPEWHVKAAGDFNGDGKADILWQNDNGTAAVWLMDGTNVAAYGNPLTNPGPSWHVESAADSNADGKADVLWQNDNGAPAVWLMDGVNVSTFGGPLYTPGTDWHVI